MRSVYVASTEGSGGKTTLSLGLALALRQRAVNAGYFKPVGLLPQRADAHLVDEDAAFVAGLLGLEDAPADICPVVLDERALHEVLTGSDVDAMARVEAAFARVSEGKDMVVCEGLGEIWQGRFLRTSGADVVQQLDLKALLVAKFAGARLLDDIAYVKDALRARLLGVIFNMVPEARLAVVENEYKPYLYGQGIATYGVILTDKRLLAVTVGEIARALEGTYVCGQEHENALVESYMIGAMSPEHALRFFAKEDHKAVIVGGDRAELILAALETETAVIVLTGDYVPSPAVLGRAEELGVPMISVASDTVTAAEGIRRLFGRLRVNDPVKIDLIARIVAERVDLSRLISDLGK
jgi:BioD-like phosphotransacetylase family protein